jgi:hypothetical protein
VWLGEGHSLYDELGLSYTLLRRDPAVGVSGLVAAARRRSVPLSVLELDPLRSPELDPWPLLLVRADQHVAWRGTEAPADPLVLVDLLRGSAR